MGKDQDNDDEFFPGFIEDDDQSADKKSAAPKKPAEPIEQDSGFNPFTDEVAPPPVVPDPVAPPPKSSGPAVADDPLVNPTTPASPADEEGFNPFAGEPTGDDDEPDDAELKPGARKDLWQCPHCGAQNRPTRDTCRSCGKSPDDPVIPPWYRKPPAMAAVAGVVIVIVLFVFMMGGPSLALRQPTAAHIHDDLQYRSAGSVAVSLEEGTFTQRGRFAATGRVIKSGRDGDGRVTMTLGFGSDASSGSQRLFDQGGQTVGFTNGIGNTTTIPFVRLTVIDSAGVVPEPPKRDSVVSLAGHYGDWEDVGTSNVQARELWVQPTGYLVEQ